MLDTGFGHAMGFEKINGMLMVGSYMLNHFWRCPPFVSPISPWSAVRMTRVWPSKPNWELAGLSASYPTARMAARMFVRKLSDAFMRLA